MELMDQFIELGSTWLLLLCLATWRALPILVLVAVLALAFRRKLSPAFHAFLWTIVVVRLLLPVSIGSPLSFHGQIDKGSNAIFGVPTNRIDIKPSADPRHSLLPNVDSTEKANSRPREVQSQTPITRNLAPEEIFGFAFLLTIIVVTVGLLCRSVISHVRFAIGLRNCRLLGDQTMIDLLLRECDSLGVGRRPKVREVPSLSAPAVFGLWRPTICLPSNLESSLTEQELRWVVRHELAHIRRRDIAVMVVASVAGACHWFNPLVWFTISRLRAAMEAAADRLALAGLSQGEAASYGNLLLRIAESGVAVRKSPTLGLLPFASGKHLKQRVELLMRVSKPNGMSAKFFPNALSKGLIVTIVLVGLTDARETERKMPELHLVANDSMESRVQPLLFDLDLFQDSEGPTFVEEYDVASIFESMPASFRSGEKTPQEQMSRYFPLASQLRDKLHVEGQTLSADLNARQHKLLKQTLEIWRNGEPGQVAIETRFIQTDIETASSIDWAGKRIDGLDVKGTGPAIAARITDQELISLNVAIQGKSRSNILFAPKVTMFDGQTAVIADQFHRPFVTGFNPKAEGGLQPVVSVVAEGLKVVLTPKLSGDRCLNLSFEVSASNIGKVSYANLPIRLPNQTAPKFTVEVPTTAVYTISASVKLAVGESVIVAIPRVFNLEAGADSETTVLVALTPRVYTPQDIAELTNRSTERQ